MRYMDLTRMFWSNGWVSEFEKERRFATNGINPSLSVYSSIFTNLWSMRAYVYISDSYRGVDLNGHIGVQWITVGYDFKGEDEEIDTIDAMEIEFGDTVEIQKTIEMVEDNLLMIGIPFASDYRFHGKNKANKIRRNNSLIRKHNIKEWEAECREYIKKEHEKKLRQIKEEQE